MSTINTSVFELFKIGPGPSSSHTIGPMRAANAFRKAVEQLPADKLGRANRIEAHLFGSLSATGKGHGTDQAVAGGLLGWTPEECDSEALTKLFSDKTTYSIKLGNTNLPLTRETIVFDSIQHNYPFQNTLIFRLYSGQELMLEKEYYSIGGGFIKCKDEPEPDKGNPVHSYNNMAEFIRITEITKKNLFEIIIENERAISGLSEKAANDKLERLIDVMLEVVERGLKADGILPGTIGLPRKARLLFERHNRPEHIPSRFLALLSAYAIAGAEENASHHKVVTAPTLGSAGVIPGILYMALHQYKVPKYKLREGMAAAALIGFICKQNASIAGAEVGCQGEIGVASAMAAALITYIMNHDINIVANAAAIALEHHLGLTCDPVGGYVQIPCIERNAVGAVHAANAYILATIGEPKGQIVRFDQVVEAMLETGRDMNCKYKETSEGGLAVCVTTC